MTLEVLKELYFGATVAEDEKSEIEDYFVETDIWDQIYSARKDIVFGDKGCGKSALFVRLVRDKEALSERRILVISAEEVKGAPAFDAVSKIPTTDLKNVWKLHLLSIIIDQLRSSDFPKVGRLRELVKEYEKILVERQILRPEGRKTRLAEIVQNVIEYVKLEAKGGVEGPAGSVKIKFRALSSTEKSGGRIFIDDMLRELDEHLDNWRVWVAIDRLDVAFRDNPDTERAVLRALFEVYRDLRGLDRTRLLIFLRKDIWQRISEGGFPEKTHVDSRAVDITWSEDALMELVARRALQSMRFRAAFKLNKDSSPNDVLEKLLPEKVDPGPKRSSAFRWLLSHTRDGNNVDSPRELIALLNEAVAQERKLAKTQDGKIRKPLISPASLKAAWPAVSKSRVHSNLFAEYPKQREYIEMLREKKCEHNIKSLSALWSLDQEKALDVVEALGQAGFFSTSGEGKARTYKVPFVFRPELGLVQGKADGVK